MDEADVFPMAAPAVGLEKYLFPTRKLSWYGPDMVFFGCIQKGRSRLYFHFV